jgi:hypothetical protein
VAPQDINLDLFAYLLLWVVIGLLAYWARGSHRPVGAYWILVYAIVGAPMLVMVSWDYVKAGNESRREMERRRRKARGNANPGRSGNAAGSTQGRKAGSGKKG